MRRLIDELLALSRVDRELMETECDPASVAAEVSRTLSQRIEAEGAELRVAVEPGRVRCADGLLRQVIWNLVDNAIKYRRQGVRAEVEVQGKIRERGYELRVCDNGMGMSVEESQRAFEPLYRAGRSRVEGTGLGLSIVKRVAEASGGSVTVESGINQGTTFVIQLQRV
jgi:signal transduction histidine kinase